MKQIAGVKLNPVKSLTSVILTSVIFTVYSVMNQSQWTPHASHSTNAGNIEELDGYVVRNLAKTRAGPVDDILTHWSGTVSYACSGHFIGKLLPCLQALLVNATNHNIHLFGG